MRVLTMTDEEYQQIERQLQGRLGHQEDLGFSGSGAKHALGILARAEEQPREQCGWWRGCTETAPAEEMFCPKHADLYEQIVAGGAG